MLNSNSEVLSYLFDDQSMSDAPDNRITLIVFLFEHLLNVMLYSFIEFSSGLFEWRSQL